MGYFQIDGHLIPDPAKFDIKNQKIETKTRLSSGKLVIDSITTKRIFELSYPFISNVNLDIFRDAYIKTGSFFTFTFRHDGSTKTATVTMNDFPESLYYEETSANNWMYKDVSITLEEQ